MSAWQKNDYEQPPQDYIELLYKDEDEEIIDCEENIDVKLELIDNKDLECNCGLHNGVDHSRHSLSGHSSLSQLNDQVPPYVESRDRSRSPLPSTSGTSSGHVVQYLNEDVMALNADHCESEFLVPVTHALFVSEECDRNDHIERNMTRLRAGRRGLRGGRSERRQTIRGGNLNQDSSPIKTHRRKNRWEVGEPLKEIWPKDDDVPLEMLSLVTDEERKRKRKAQVAGRVPRNAEREDDSESDSDDEIIDSSTGEDVMDVIALEGQSRHFEWSPMETFQGQEETFKPERTGAVNAVSSAYDAFRRYWSDDVLDLIVIQTNLYASKITASAFQREWFPTNNHEILCLFSFWMMLGIIRMPTITSCFSVDPLLKTEVFRRIFTRRRFEMLSRALNFVDSGPVKNNSPSNTRSVSIDRLHCLRPILTHLNSCFQSNYILNKNICIDESLILWKGRSGFKQYIHNKAYKFGIKTFELCESTTGYLWSFIVYSGKQTETELEQEPGSLKSTAVVKKLIGPLLNKGHRLFLDNCYNSPLLARYLKLNGTDCVGTLRPTRRDVPVLINLAPLDRGELIARHSGDVTVLSWQDKKRITMISTCHGSSNALPTVNSKRTSHPVPFKPQVVLDYNKYMGGIDLKDQMLEPYLIERKRGAKWHMKIFKRLLNVSILNSGILLESSTEKRHDHAAFRLQLVDSILEHHLQHCPRNRRHSSSRSTHQLPDRLVPFKHWPVLLEPTASSLARNRHFTKRCVVCLRNGLKSQKTPYCCESCKVPLCIRDCFKLYHT